jgi:hypothetical protein
MIRDLLKKMAVLGIVGIAFFFVQGSAYSQTIFSLIGVNDSNLRASVEFDYNYDDTTGTIDIDITNISILEPDPRLTAFAFNTPPSVTGFSSFTGETGWSGYYNPNGINTPGQFGLYDMAGLTGPNFNGGDANDGIPISSTFSFSFILTGSDLNLLDDDDFLGRLSANEPGGGDQFQYFIGRFQRTGFDGEGSDVAIPGDIPVTEPAIIFLLGIGLAGLGAITRKR